MRLYLGAALLCAVAIASTLRLAAQESPIVENRWLARAEVLTSHLKDDAKKLDQLDRGILLARLGEAWWETDKYKAFSFFSEAIKQVTPSPEKEDPTDRSSRLATARAMLPIIAPRDKQLAAALTAMFMPAEEANPNRSNVEDAVTLVEAASTIVSSDPERAYELATAALRLGASYKLASLLWKMRGVNVKLSDSLFAQSLAWSGENNDINLLSALSMFAFRGPAPSDGLRKAVLETMAAWITRPTTTPGEQVISCQVASTAAGVINQFDRLMPYQAPIIRGLIARCQLGQNENSSRRVNEKLSDRAPKTVDDLLKAADNSRSSKERDDFLSRAAYLAFEEKNFVRAIEILVTMSDEGRVAMKGTWESWRETFAGFAAVGFFKSGDQANMEKIIEATPITLRASVELAVTDEMIRAKKQTLAIEMLQRGRRDVVKSQEFERAVWSLALIRRYAQLLPLEAPEVFREAVKAINQVKDFSPPKTGRVNEDKRNGMLANEIVLNSFDLPSSLLESDEAGTLEATGSIEDPVIRAAIRANLLRNCVKQYRTTQHENNTATSQGAK